MKLTQQGDYVSLLIWRTLICISLLLSSIIFYISLGKINLINGRFCHWTGQSPQGFHHILNQYFYFADARGFILYIWVIFWFWFILSLWARVGISCSLLVCLGLHIFFFTFELCRIECFCYLWLFSDTVDMSVFLPYDKLFEVQCLAHALLQTQPITVCQIMSFGGQGQFFTRHAQLY